MSRMERNFFFANRTLALKETPSSPKQPKKNKNYNEILEKPFIFNLQTVSTTCRRCRSFRSRPDVVGCGREVATMVSREILDYVMNLFYALLLIVVLKCSVFSKCCVNIISGTKPSN
jgi:hypothetical protein